ncbi:MAG: (2Fe-2S) ferredoxin domain-containing protein [Candidatus Obscuribacterales bacterium]|nr:(2Fe-2S) ferredoxin domain-containing protein [Candidatus Obscuribacterales bacterium]
MNKTMVELHICTSGKTCPKRGSCEIAKKLKETVSSLNLDDKVLVHEEGCMGLCRSGPNIIAMPYGTKYGYVQETDLPKIVQENADKMAAHSKTG